MQIALLEPITLSAVASLALAYFFWEINKSYTSEKICFLHKSQRFVIFLPQFHTLLLGQINPVLTGKSIVKLFLLCFIPVCPYTEGTWLHCDYFIWCVLWLFYLVFIMCGCVYVRVCCNVCGGRGGGCSTWVCICGGFVIGGGFVSMCTCICYVFYCLYCVFLFLLCIFILICFVCTSVRTTANEWQLNCNKKW
jgi:hypothetical protein